MKLVIDGYYAIANNRGMARYCRNACSITCAKPVYPKKTKLIPFPIWEQIILPWILRRIDADVHIFPYNTAPLIASNKKTILVIHDTIFATNLSQITIWNVFSKKILVSLYRQTVCKLAARRATAILTVSRHSKRRITEVFGIDEEKIDVISNTLAEEFENSALQTTRAVQFNYNVLFVSGDADSKNLRFALEGLDRFAEKYQFVLNANIVGVSRAKHEKIKEKLKFINTCLHVNIDDRSLVELYTKSDCLIVPSLEEGFSIPIIEALATETPVIASDTSCLPEILGNVGLYFNPQCVESFVGALASFYVSGNKIERKDLRDRYLTNYSRIRIKSQWNEFLIKLQLKDKAKQ